MPPFTRMLKPSNRRSQSVALVLIVPELRSIFLAPDATSTVSVWAGPRAAVGEAWTAYSIVTCPGDVAVAPESAVTCTLAYERLSESLTRNVFDGSAAADAPVPLNHPEIAGASASAGHVAPAAAAVTAAPTASAATV